MAIRTRVALAVVLATLAAPAKADLIKFETDTTGIKANGFLSNDSTRLSFSTTSGRQLNLANFGTQGDGISLASTPDDPAGEFLFAFTQPFNTLSLSFGNDDQDNSSPGDRAWLRLFLGASPVGTAFVDLNRNDIMDQTIAFSGALFDNAEFFYGTPGGTPTKITEIIDNISFDIVPLPEPSTLPLLLSGWLALTYFRRGRHSRPAGATRGLTRVVQAER